MLILLKVNKLPKLYQQGLAYMSLLLDHWLGDVWLKDGEGTNHGNEDLTRHKAIIMVNIKDHAAISLLVQTESPILT